MREHVHKLLRRFQGPVDVLVGHVEEEGRVSLQLLHDADRVRGEGVGRVRVVVLELRSTISPTASYFLFVIPQTEQLCKFAQAGDQRVDFLLTAVRATWGAVAVLAVDSARS